LLGGKGGFKDMQTAYAWAYPPACVAIVLFLAGHIPTWFVLIGGENHIFTLLTLPQDPWQELLQTSAFLLVFWTVILWITNVSEAHQISVLRSFLLIVLSMIPVFVAGIAGIVLLIFAGLISRLPPLAHFP
jgi:hypothetical protein